MAQSPNLEAAVVVPIDDHLYRDLRGVAAAFLAGERRDHTLTATDLLHEAYLRLPKCETDRTISPDAFRRLAAQIMRHVLVDHARRRATEKRDAGRRIAIDDRIDDQIDAAVARDEYVVAFDRALADLAEIDDGLVAVVDLLFFGGCTVDETARALDLSPRTVKRRWSLAKGWLHREIKNRGKR